MKNIHKIDLAIIFFTVFSLIFVVGYVSPRVIAPLDKYETKDSKILFSISNADKILIDDNSDFTTPEEYVVEDGLKINLMPGKYYWKAVGVFGSEIRTFTINSEVNLELLENVDGSFGVSNAGNVALNVDVYNESGIVESLKLGVGAKENSSGNKFVGGLDG